ncbi:hypothetical protein S4A8_02858 [Salinisphaera sp. S4-8]
MVVIEYVDTEPVSGLAHQRCEFNDIVVIELMVARYIDDRSIEFFSRPIQPVRAAVDITGQHDNVTVHVVPDSGRAGFEVQVGEDSNTHRGVPLVVLY